MVLKSIPKLNRSYWVAILIASICGTNFGDFFPDTLKVGAAGGLVILFALFAAIILADKMLKQGSEVFYWLAILVVCVAATNIADLLIGWHPSYISISIGFTLLLAFLISLERKISMILTLGLTHINGFYWLTMLTAGAFGTVIGDGIGHSFKPVEIGVPISAAIATFVVAFIFTIRIKLKWTTPVAYWVAVVTIRWWGTNFGDMLAFLITILGSITVTGLGLILALYFWPTSYPYKLNRK